MITSISTALQHTAIISGRSEIVACCIEVSMTGSICNNDIEASSCSGAGDSQTSLRATGLIYVRVMSHFNGFRF